MKKSLVKRYFITGLLIWVPLVITLWVLGLLVSAMDQSLLLLPSSSTPNPGWACTFPAWACC